MINLIIFLLLNQPSDFIGYVEKNGRAISPSYKESNCVQFLTKVIELYTKTSFTKEEIKDIYIASYTMEQVNDILKNNKKESTKLDGIVPILINKGLATKIDGIENIESGCIIQYWTFHKKDGITKIAYGHSAIVQKIDSNGDIFILSSHPKNNGYGITKLEKKYGDIFGIYRIAICKPKF